MPHALNPYFRLPKHLKNATLRALSRRLFRARKRLLVYSATHYKPLTSLAVIITPLGLSSFKIQTATATVLLDPHDGSQGIRPPRAQADLTLIARAEGRNRSAGGENSFVIDGPGEFEVKGVAVYGIAAAESGQTFFVIEVEDLRLGHLGDLNRLLQDSELEHLDGVDVLFLPIGGHGVLDSRKAQDIVSEIEPRIVIPMHFKLSGLKASRDPATTFCREFGVKNAEPQEKIRLTKKDLPQEETNVVILSPSHA